jgi:hypothetical protein
MEVSTFSFLQLSFQTAQGRKEEESEKGKWWKWKEIKIRESDADFFRFSSQPLHPHSEPRLV